MRRLALALIAAPVLYILAGFLGALVPGPVAPVPGARTDVIGLARGPIQYDLLIPLTDETRAAFGFVARDGLPIGHRDAEWLVLGWGAAGIAAGGNVTAPALWRALTGDGAVLRLDLAGDVSGVGGLSWIEASPAQIAALRAVVLQAFRRDAEGEPMALPPGLQGQVHVVYQAKGRFDLIRSGNAWIGQALRAAGLPFGAWTPTTQALSLSLWWNRA